MSFLHPSGILCDNVVPMLYDDHHRLGKSPGSDQNEPATAMTAVILWIFQMPSFALKSMAYCTLTVCRAVRVPVTYLVGIVAPDRTSTRRHSLQLVLTVGKVQCRRVH